MIKFQKQIASLYTGNKKLQLTLIFILELYLLILGQRKINWNLKSPEMQWSVQRGIWLEAPRTVPGTG